MIVNIDGTFVAAETAALSVSDGAVLFGDTLFETLKAHGATICFFQHHLDRIELSCRYLQMPFDRRRAQDALLGTAERLQWPVSRLRLTVSRGSFTSLAFPPAQQGHIIVTAAPYTEPDEQERRQGANCVFAPNRRVNPLCHLPQMKRGNYADCLYATAFARHRGAHEALFTTEDQQVLEGATSNLFIFQGQALITPPAGKLVLGGIMRRQVLETATALGISAEERELSVTELYGADEVFITNALIDLLPISCIEGRPLARGAAWQRILAALAARNRP